MPSAYEIVQAQIARSTFFSGKPIAPKNGGLLTNVGIAKDAYFKNFGGNKDSSFWKTFRIDAEGNAPGSLVDAEKLWALSGNSKGMVVTSKYLQTAGQDPRGATYKSPEYQVRYGFMFHYNPTTIDMSYAGVPDMDVTMFTSGREAFNVMGTAATQSQIEFTLVLNRMFDMQYFDGRTGLLKEGVTRTSWSGRFPSNLREQKDLYNKGTMYDLEFFLRTVMQISIPTFLKQRNAGWETPGTTSDLGFLQGFPVELHLGKSLRYLVRIDSFKLRHQLFDQRMVPIFTELSIVASRIPDYSTNIISKNPSTPSYTRTGSSRDTGKIQGTSATVNSASTNNIFSIIKGITG
jgi:hypothetical protein